MKTAAELANAYLEWAKRQKEEQGLKGKSPEQLRDELRAKMGIKR